MLIKKLKSFLVLTGIIFIVDLWSADISLIIPIYQDEKQFPSFFKSLTQDPLFGTYDVLIEAVASYQHKQDLVTPLVEEYPNVRVIKVYNNPGIGFLLNIAVHASYGEYLMMISPAFRYKQYAFDLMKEQFSKKPNIEMVFAGYYKINSSIDSFYDIYATNEQLIPIVKERPYLDLNCPVMWKKSLHKKHGFFNDAYCATADMDFWVRATKKGLSSFFYKKVCSVSVPSQQSIRSNFDYSKEYKLISSFYFSK